MRFGTGIWIVVAVVLAGLGGGLAWVFLQSPNEYSNRASPSVRAVLRSPASYRGRRVMVIGSVDAVYNSHAITLGGSQTPGLLVTGKHLPLGTTVKRNAIVRVTGVVHSFSAAKWRAWTGGSDPARTLTLYDGKPVIRVDRIEPASAQAMHARTSPSQPQLQPATTGG